MLATINQPKVSVIVPCYNVAQYVGQCMECLINQTLTDLEIIVIDDKSTDDTLKILSKFAKRDKRIQIIAKRQNSGVSSARNAGLDVASGEYVGFVDPDDTVDNDFFRTLYNMAKENKSDMAAGIIKTIEISGIENLSDDHIELNQNKYNMRNGFWRAIYNRQMLNSHNLRFQTDLCVAEDIDFMVHAVCYANNITASNNVAYNYCRRTNSADSLDMSSVKLLSNINAVQKLVKLANIQTYIAPDQYEYILKCAYSIAKYMQCKNINQSDKPKLSDTFKWLYQNTKWDYMHNNIMNSTMYHALKSGNDAKIYSAIFAKNTRLRLFGAIPLLKISTCPGRGRTFLLFEFIPVLQISNIANKQKFYVCGINILSIKK